LDPTSHSAASLSQKLVKPDLGLRFRALDG